MSFTREQVQQAIPAKFVMISGSEDKQTSADVFNVGTFELPNPAGKAGGACTSTLLKVLNEHSGPPLSWIDLLHKMRGVLRQKVSSMGRFQPIVCMSTSFSFVSSNKTGL